AHRFQDLALSVDLVLHPVHLGDDLAPLVVAGARQDVDLAGDELPVQLLIALAGAGDRGVIAFASGHSRMPPRRFSFAGGICQRRTIAAFGTSRGAGRHAWLRYRKASAGLDDQSWR